jgi:small subunit ribosomal protein S6
MSRKYEGMIVLNTKTIEGSVEELVAAVGKEIEAEGAKLDEVQQLGRKKFAYNSRHLESGHYVNYFFKAEPDAIDRIQSRLKLNGHVHLQHFQRVA